MAFWQLMAKKSFAILKLLEITTDTVQRTFGKTISPIAKTKKRCKALKSLDVYFWQKTASKEGTKPLPKGSKGFLFPRSLLGANNIPIPFSRE